MRQRLSRAERNWLEDHSSRLRRMMTALDDDLDKVEQVEWSLFWSDMRRLYSRTAIHLETALRTRDRKCLETGQQLWETIEDRLVSAERRLHG